MNNKYYIAQVSEMWVSQAWTSIGKIELTVVKEHSKHLNEDEAFYVKEKTGAKIIEVTVTIAEKEIGVME